MLHNTRGLVLRTIKYGETSLICTIFTELWGVQSYIMQGVRTNKGKQNRAGMLQPSTLLELTVYHKPNQNLQRIREFHPAYIYTSMHEHIVKNCIAMFSTEVLLRSLPEHAPIPELFDKSFEFFHSLDKVTVNNTGNYPVYFLITCCGMLGYNVAGRYSAETPYISLQEGGFCKNLPVEQSAVTDSDAKMLDQLLQVNSTEAIADIKMSSTSRFRLLDWLLAFMHNHTSHMGEIKSLPILRTVLHS